MYENEISPTTYWRYKINFNSKSFWDLGIEERKYRTIVRNMGMIAPIEILQQDFKSECKHSLGKG